MHAHYIKLSLQIFGFYLLICENGATLAPPSIISVCPFTIPAVRRNKVAYTTSSTSTNFPIGMRLSIPYAFTGSDHAYLPILVITTVGFTQLTVIPYSPSSNAITLDR